MTLHFQIFAVPGVFSMKFSKYALSTLSAATLGFLALGVASTPAAAGTATATFNVNAKVQTSCTVTAADLDFGIYTGIEKQVPGGGITVNCTNGTPYTIALDLGKHNGSGNTRYMLNKTDNKTTLGYQLFSENTYSTPWNSDSASTVSGTGNGSNQTALQVFGQIPGGEAVVAGDYTDTITINLSY
jgi:spore coat protein U-like protein